MYFSYNQNYQTADKFGLLVRLENMDRPAEYNLKKSSTMMYEDKKAISNATNADYANSFPWMETVGIQAGTTWSSNPHFDNFGRICDTSSSQLYAIPLEPQAQALTNVGETKELVFLSKTFSSRDRPNYNATSSSGALIYSQDLHAQETSTDSEIPVRSLSTDEMASHEVSKNIFNELSASHRPSNGFPPPKTQEKANIYNEFSDVFGVSSGPLQLEPPQNIYDEFSDVYYEASELGIYHSASTTSNPERGSNVMGHELQVLEKNVNFSRRSILPTLLWSEAYETGTQSRFHARPPSLNHDQVSKF